MTRRFAHTEAHPLLDISGQLLVVEKRDVLFPGQSDHDPQAMALGHIEQPARRHRVNAHRIDPVFCHLSKIPVDHFGSMILAAVLIRAKRTVSYAAHIELLIAHEEELALDPRPHPFNHRNGLRGFEKELDDPAGGRRFGENGSKHHVFIRFALQQIIREKAARPFFSRICFSGPPTTLPDKGPHHPARLQARVLRISAGKTPGLTIGEPVLSQLRFIPHQRRFCHLALAFIRIFLIHPEVIMHLGI